MQESISQTLNTDKLQFSSIMTSEESEEIPSMDVTIIFDDSSDDVTVKEEQYEEVYDVPGNLELPTAECGELFCRLGCVCVSVKTVKIRPKVSLEHCSLPDCMLQCVCGYLPSKPSSRKCFAKLQKGNESFYSKINWSGVRQRRERRVPKRYSEFYLGSDRIALSTPPSRNCRPFRVKVWPDEIKLLRWDSFVSLAKVDVSPDQKVFCMKHSVYSCQCIKENRRIILPSNSSPDQQGKKKQPLSTRTVAKFSASPTTKNVATNMRQISPKLAETTPSLSTTSQEPSTETISLSKMCKTPSEIVANVTCDIHSMRQDTGAPEIVNELLDPCISPESPYAFLLCNGVKWERVGSLSLKTPHKAKSPTLPTKNTTLLKTPPKISDEVSISVHKLPESDLVSHKGKNQPTKSNLTSRNNIHWRTWSSQVVKLPAIPSKSSPTPSIFDSLTLLAAPSTSAILPKSSDLPTSILPAAVCQIVKPPPPSSTSAAAAAAVSTETPNKTSDVIFPHVFLGPFPSKYLAQCLPFQSCLIPIPLINDSKFPNQSSVKVNNTNESEPSLFQSSAESLDTISYVQQEHKEVGIVIENSNDKKDELVHSLVNRLDDDDEVSVVAIVGKSVSAVNREVSVGAQPESSDGNNENGEETDVTESESEIWLPSALSKRSVNTVKEQGRRGQMGKLLRDLDCLLVPDSGSRRALIKVVNHATSTIKSMQSKAREMDDTYRELKNRRIALLTERQRIFSGFPTEVRQMFSCPMDSLALPIRHLNSISSS